MANTLWTGISAVQKLYEQSGQFSSTIKTSLDVAAIGNTPSGISSDDVDVIWANTTGGVSILWKQSGRFSSTVKSSQSVTSIDTTVLGSSWDGVNRSYTGREADKLYLQSGETSSTLKTSQSIGSIDNTPSGVSWDGTNTTWSGQEATDKLYLQSGQFSSTLKTSEPTSEAGGQQGRCCVWDGTDTDWVGVSPFKFFKQSGQFTSTIKTSQSAPQFPVGIETGTFTDRLPPPPAAPLPPQAYRRFNYAKYPPLDFIAGRMRRAFGVEENDVALVPGKLPTHFKRFIHAKSPPLHHIQGRMQRRFGVSDPVALPNIYRQPRRNLRAKSPPRGLIKARHRWAFGKTPPWIEYFQTYQQGFRIADASLDLYELYAGEDASPDFTASGQPVATSPTLPFNWTPTPPGAGTKVLHLVVRKRNPYNLLSFNVGETLLEIDTGSTEVLLDVTPPLDVRAYETISLSVKVVSKYDSSADPNPADTFEIYAKVGSDPVIGVDAPVFSGVMEFLGIESMLSEIIGTYTAGDVVHIIVAALRTSDTNRGAAAAIQYTIPASLDLTNGNMFGGSVYEQR